MSNSFLARISILDSAGNFISLPVKRDVKIINIPLILFNDVTICDTKLSVSAILTYRILIELVQQS